MRNNFEIRVLGRREDTVCENAMKGLGKMLPERFIVLAKNAQQFRDFMKVIDRPMRDGVFAEAVERIRGLERDPTVVQIGNYFEAENFVDVSNYLDTRGRITNVTVTDWR